MSFDATPFSREEVIREIRELNAEIGRHPEKKLALKVHWYERTLLTNAEKAATGMMLLTVSDGTERVPDAIESDETEVPSTVDLHASAKRQVVISIHGIRTRGDWQKQLTSSLSRADFIHEPLDFGFFRAIQLVIPAMRDAKVKWFLEEYTKAIRDSADPPCVIAHSFGTYLVRGLSKSMTR